MPGYGYAAAAKSKVAAWTALIDAFLRGRANLARVYVLVDARHGLKTDRRAALDALGEAAVSHQIVLDQSDADEAFGARRPHEEVEAALAKRAAAFPGLPTSRMTERVSPNCARPSPGCWRKESAQSIVGMAASARTAAQ